VPYKARTTMQINKKLFLYSIPILIGSYLIYKQFSKGKGGTEDAPAPDNALKGKETQNTYSAPSGTYPLKMGKKNSTVGVLQNLLNTALQCQNKTLLKTDSDFGSKTQAALSSLTGKSSVIDENELEAIKNQLSATCNASASLDWAWKLIEAQNSGKYSYLMVAEPMSFNKVTKDFTGKWVANKKPTVLTLPAKNYSLSDYVLRSATTNGNIRMEIMNGALAGMYISNNGDLNNLNIS
jgi:hypothetical protein